MSGRQGTRATEPYRNSRLSDQPPEERARTDPFEICSDFWAVCLKPPLLNRHLQSTIRVRHAITQASNVMIKSSLLDTSFRLLQCYGIEFTALICHTKRLSSEPLFSVGTGAHPISVDRQPCFCLIQWYDRELTAFGMSHRTAPREPLLSVGTGVQPLFVNR